jgi:hypothetical protein
MGRQNQTPTPASTDTIGGEDESLTTNQAAAPIPLSMGETKNAARWITPIYGQRSIKQKAAVQDKNK